MTFALAGRRGGYEADRLSEGERDARRVAMRESGEEEGRSATLLALVLARESGLTHYRSEVQERQRGDSGLAILSRHPLEAAEASELTLTRPPCDAILKAVVRPRGEPVTLINGFYRAGYDREGRKARLRATEIVLKLVRDAEGAVIFGGDLNATSERPGIPELGR